MSPSAQPALIAAIAISLILGGCLSRLNYSLVGRSPNTILVPPRSTPTEATRSFDAQIKHARSQHDSTRDCEITHGPITLNWRGDTADVRLAPLDRNQGMLSGARSDPTQIVDTFERALLDIESRGCLGPDQEFGLKQAITERLPLPVSLAQRLLFGSFDVTGFFDLTSGFRMKITSPIYRAGTDRSAKNLISYDVAYYSFTRGGSDDHIRFALDSMNEPSLEGQSYARSKPQGRDSFYRAFGYFRLLFRAAPAGSGSLTQAIVLSAADKTKINEATDQIHAGFASFCQAVAVPDVSCAVFPPDVGVSLEIRVLVNGKPTFVQAVGASVGDVLDPDAPDKRVRLSRNFQGRSIPVKFNPADVDISRLALMPGDRITW